jgi:outer membrane protein, multidrug efflux system
MKPQRLFLLASVALLGGCASVGEPDVRPEILMPANYSFAPPASAAGAPQLESLLPASDPAFVALVKRASDAPDLAITLARIEGARAVAKRAGAERLPSIDASGNVGVSRTNQSGSLPPGISIDNTRFSIGGDISASWDPDLFGRLRASERAAKLRLDAAGFDAEAVRIAIASDVAAALVDWQSVAAQKAQLQANVDSAQERARLIGSRVRAGLNPGLDSMRAEAVIEGLRAQLAPLQGQEAQIVARLVALTASSADAVQADLALSGRQWTGGDAPSTAPSALVAARPDVQAAASRLAASDADLAATAARRYPQFTLSSALGLLAFSLGGLFDSDAITGQLGAGIAGPLIDFGRIEADIARDKAQTRIAFQELRKASFGALGEAEESFGLLAAADREAALLARQAARESEVAKVTASRYRAGLESLIAVLDADRTAYQAQQAAVAAKGRAQRARINLWQSLGGPDYRGLFKVNPINGISPQS